jgi:hypothetical protein
MQTNDIHLSRFFALETVGEIDLTGKATVLAAAYDQNEPVILYLSGATTAVNAIRAGLNGTKAKIYMKRKIYGAKLFQASRPMKQYHTRDDQLEEDHLLLLSDMLFHTSTSDKTSYVMTYVDEAHPATNELSRLTMGQRIKQAVTLPIVPEWYAPLIERGMRDQRIYKLDSFGCRAWGITMNQEYWSEQIQTMLAARQLTFPIKKAY